MIETTQNLYGLTKICVKIVALLLYWQKFLDRSLCRLSSKHTKILNGFWWQIDNNEPKKMTFENITYLIVPETTDLQKNKKKNIKISNYFSL
jgi:hypothetical protein